MAEDHAVKTIHWKIGHCSFSSLALSCIEENAPPSELSSSEFFFKYQLGKET